MQPILSIVTIHKGSLYELERTVDSIYLRLDDQTEHIVVGSVLESEIGAIRKTCFRSKLVVNEDISLYDAMNIGVRHSKGRFVNFINSGDELCEPIPTGELIEITCYIFIPTLYIDSGTHVAGLHGANHQNIVAPNDKAICFDEAYLCFADAHWINQMIARYGSKLCPRQYATFHYGGLSTRPTLRQALQNMRMDTFLRARVKLLIKALFVSVGLERVNKYLLLRGYR